MDRLELVRAMRAKLKAHAPGPLRAALKFARAQVGRPPIDDVVLGDFRLEQEPGSRARLNFVIPRLAAGADFGGVATGIDVFLRLWQQLRELVPLDMRLIVTDVTGETDAGIFTRRAEKAGEIVQDDQVFLARSTSATIPVRINDLFFTYNWWTTLNIDGLVSQQTAVFGRGRLPIIYLIQDYEAMFHQYSSAHLLARDSLDAVPRLWTIVNSSNLQQFIELMGHRPERSFVFDPVVSEALRPYLGQARGSVREKRILVYGRPAVERNCWPALVRGLRRWARDYPQFADWEVISAGTEHPSVPLGDGREIRSVGKLSLDDYAATLLQSSVGVSLMASPHPSYPPLEMAHFGLRTVTNGYLCKDLSSYHGNITSVASIQEGPLAAAIADACAQHGQPADAEANAGYLRTDAYPFLPDLVAAIQPELS
jgi:O-antigen biosynthesis protein